MLLGSGRSTKGKSDISPNFRAIIRRITSARLALRISGSVNSGRVWKSSSEKRRMQTPFSTRPHLPLRCSALLWDMAVTGREVVLDRGVYRDMRASPVSMTYLMPGMVMDVSAILVAISIFLAAVGAKALDCSAAESRANKGSTATFLYCRPSIASRVSRISCSVGMKMRMSPKGLSR